MRGKLQRFGSAMMAPVLLFPFFGAMLGLSVVMLNTSLFPSLAQEGTIWHGFWDTVLIASLTIFQNMPFIFVLGLPIALAKKAPGRAVFVSFVGYVVFNYYINGILAHWGDFFGYENFLTADGLIGVTEVAGRRTLDTGVLGGIVVAAIMIWLHNKYFEKELPEWLGIFQGTPLVSIVAFILMFPIALFTCFVWPVIQQGITSLQGLMVSSGVFGVWLYTFLERILIPTGLHHFIYAPFLFGPAVVEGGIVAQWIENLPALAQSTEPLREMFPYGFALHGNSKIFGVPGIALAMYLTAKPQNRKKVGGLLLAATLTSVVTGITEPIEFTFLFIAPYLFAIHSVLAATMAATMYAFGVVGNFGGGLIEFAFMNWVPLFANHWTTYLIQILIGLAFTAIYFFLFRYLILKLDIPLPGRQKDEDETKLYTKKDYQQGKSNSFAGKAKDILVGLGGKDNIVDVTSCATRLRVTVKDPSLVKDDKYFLSIGAHGLVVKENSIQVIVGLSVSQVREHFEGLLK
ncbi:alpha-glucoside-specific PTS transporter subunit IIBC [Anaerobranca gottschalkii]|uniref:PTS system maltose-specific IIB component, Glc family /PTS system maltose-specific IIC component, Glc family n=1 Tax=Anaerobranca gottschalkii DSM 13577 TaxID=1120990 RepID=A0A1I0AQ19_9FIRM|nr:alpha-glucoside-specific PTS transporter subunit IIBC [Anaerobranca gottschalkii]SES95861.1 PTS system maltose-specific IIB component, Glc family /PTS system maltose-specific IIC component, Glc family [Anaerobranca gottschalkii DSM 13577]